MEKDDFYEQLYAVQEWVPRETLIDFCKFHRLVTVSTLFEPRACQKVNWVWIGQQRTSNRSTISYEGVTV